MVPINKDASNLAFIWEPYYATTLLKEIVFIGGHSHTYEKTNNHN